MKYINADELKGALLYKKKSIDLCELNDLINELSEERECDNNLYKALETIEKLCDNQNPTHEEIWRIAYDAIKAPIQQPTPLKIAIKGDGTEEYSKVIFQYFSSHTIKGLHDIYSFEQEDYYFIENNKLVFSLNLPEGYTEVSLKEGEKAVTDNSKANTYLLNRVEELEKELIDLKLKLKDLSK